jgi:branched-subunit amino acid aminotransferase/4-amino-4-deoxychorismate lyase
MPGRIWLDGRLVPAAGPHISVSDRGFQLGDGVFETARARRGVVIELAEHLRRLHESADATALPLPEDDAHLTAGIAALLEAEGLAGTGADGSEPGDAAIRITASRGPLERRGLLPPGWESVTATLVIQAWPYAPPPERLLEDGARAIVSEVRRDPSSPLAGIKSTSRADYVHAKLEAERAGVDDALFLTLDGAVSESTTANVFAVVAGRLVTPPTDAAILAGTTRTWLLAHAAECGLEAIERRLALDELVAADEAFLTSSVAGLVPLVALAGRTIGTGRPGPWSIGLREARERWIDEVSRAAVGLRPAVAAPSWSLR